MRLSKEARLRQLYRWEGSLNDLMREMEEKSHLVACRDIHAATRLAWRETTRVIEEEKDRLPERSGDDGE